VETRRAFLAGVGSVALTGCLDAPATTTPSSSAESTSGVTPPTTGSESRTESATTDTAGPCDAVAALADTQYDLAVVVADAPVVPLDLTVAVRVIRTPLDTPIPETPVASPDEPDGGETATRRSYGDITFRERFLLRERYTPVFRRDVFGDETEFQVRVEAGDSGTAARLVEPPTDDPAGVEVGVDADGAFAGTLDRPGDCSTSTTE